MQSVSEFITHSGIISDNDMDTSSDDHMEDDEQEEMEIEHFSLSEEWMEKIRRIGDDSLSYVCGYMEVDLIEEENEDFFWRCFSLRRVNAIEKKTYSFEYGLPGSYSKPRGRPRNKSTEERSKFLADYIETNTTAILDELKLKLCEKFEGLKISISAIHKHLVHKHNITLKKLEKIPAARNSDR
ncbi:hypothetical protein A0J61_06250, partial [Choanephora cucurbitarum]